MILAAPFAYLCGLIYLEWQSPGEVLGADPGEAVVHYSGEWAIIFVLLAFSVTPLRRLFLAMDVTRGNLGFLFTRSRRLFGLFAFFYALVHLLAYVIFFLEFSLDQLLQDVLERTYITAGMLAFVILFFMALTSTRGWQRRLRARWSQLHKLIYLGVGLSILHLWWLTRDDFAEVVVFGAWYMALLVLRLRAA